MDSPLEEEMGSLFDGMVLFNPSDNQDHLPSPTPSTPSTSAAAAAEPSPSSSSSVPLDENLFSDLTIVTPIEALTLRPQSTISTVSTTLTTEIPKVSRQLSRRKKKASIKIGYGRDTSLPDDSSPSLPTPNSSSIAESYSSSLSSDHNSLPKELNSESVSSKSKIETEIGDRGKIGSESHHPSISSDVNSLPKESESPVAAHSELLSSKSIIENDIGELEKSSFEDADGKDGSIPEVEHEASKDDAGDGSNEEKLEKIRARISERLEEIRGMAVSLSATRKETARKRRKASENLDLASIKYKKLERELEEACEAEDFERAERVSESLAAAEREREDFVNALREAEADCDSVDLKVQEILKSQIAAEEEGVLLLEQFTKDASDNADLVLRNAQEISSKEMNEWLSSVEALEVKKMELEVESHLINDARFGLNDVIEHTIEDDKREKEILCKKKDVLTEELEKLLDLVRQKEAEIAESSSYIQEIEKRIADAVSGFHEAQSSIDSKYDNTQSVLSKMHLESETLSMKKKEIDEFLSQEEKRGAKLRELASVSMLEAQACQELVALRKSLALPILKSREVRVKLAKTEEKILEDVQILRQEACAARASLQELSSTRSSIQQEIASSKQRMFFIDKRIPELESEKKVAASARNFKEAGRIASEAKTLIVEKESIQVKMEAAILELGNMEREIEGTVNRMNGSEELILSKEKEAAMAGWQRLRLVAAAAMAERSAALRLGDLEEAKVLLAEADAVDSQAKKLQQTYNLEEEEFGSTAEQLISMELITNLGGKQLAEMAASVSHSAE